MSGDSYCSTNERDGLGDNLVPDYITRVREGATDGLGFSSVTMKIRDILESVAT